MNKQFLSFTFFLFISVFLFGQTYDSTAWKYAKTIDQKNIYRHLSTLASAEYEGRETGELGQKMAMNYIVKHFKDHRILDYGNHGYIQWYEVYEQENNGVTVDIKNKKFEINKDFLMSPAVVNNGDYNLDFVFVGHGIEEEKYNSYEGIDVKGKAVFFLTSQPDKVNLEDEWNIEKKVELAKEKGALGVFYEQSDISAFMERNKSRLNRKRSALSYNVDLEEPFYTFRMNKAMTQELLSVGNLRYKSVSKKGVKLKNNFTSQLTVKIDKPTRAIAGENVFAYIRGTDKQDEVVVISAHYDHLGKIDNEIYYGADDNASGTAALLEIAAAFQKAAIEGNRPRRSILLIAFSGEEKGLLGSSYYVNYPIIPLEQTVANLNIDMIGRHDKAHVQDSNYIYLIGSDKLSDDLHTLSEKVNKLYTNISLDYTFNSKDDPNKFYYRSDHYNFAKNNIPVIFYFNGIHEDYHKPTDTVDKIDFKKTTHISRYIFLTAWHIANAEKRLELNDNIEK